MRNIRVTSIRRRIQSIVEDFVEDFYVKDEPRPTAKQLVKEIMKELEPSIWNLHDTLQKSRPNLYE